VLAAAKERDPAGQSLEIAPKTAAARQVRALSHPGLLVLRRPYDVRAKRVAASIPVDEVRRLKSFLGLTAAEGTWRVVIVDAADELNLNAANALLKSLEEPPTRALLPLIASEPSRLLPTIRRAAGARCPRWRRGCARWIRRPAARWNARRPALAAARAAGRGQRASGSAARRQRRIDAYDASSPPRCAPQVDWPAVHTLSISCPRPPTSSASRPSTTCPRSAGAAGAGAGNRTPRPELALAQRLIPEARLPAWAALWEAILSERADAALLNLDKKALMLGTFSRLEALAHR
jgi:DNA polymerase-3 subunit delta'